MNHYPGANPEPEPVDATQAAAASTPPIDAGAVRTALTDALRSTAVLADVTIGTWSGERSDPKAMETLAQNAGARGKVGRVVKNLMAGADKRLKDAQSAYISVRSAHTAMTTPWVTDLNAGRLSGPRLLPNMLFEKYLEAIGVRKKAAVAALDEMLAHYDEDVATARANLGDLADITYPTADEVRAMFHVKIDIEPLPAASGFQNLPAHFASKLAESLQKKQESMMASAQGYLWEVARERSERMYDRMSQPDVMFKASTVEAWRGLTGLLPAWNVAGDPRVTTVVGLIGDALEHLDADAIRKDANTRARMAQAAKGVVDLLDEWGVGKAP